MRSRVGIQESVLVSLRDRVKLSLEKIRDCHALIGVLRAEIVEAEVLIKKLGGRLI